MCFFFHFQLPETEDVSATAIRKNKYTVGILKAILKTAAESDAGAMKRKGIKGEMKYVENDPLSSLETPNIRGKRKHSSE